MFSRTAKKFDRAVIEANASVNPKLESSTANKGLSDLGIRFLFSTADLIIEMDEFVGRGANRIFQILPTSLQEKIKSMNSRFKAGRNRALGLELSDSSSKPQTASDLEMQRGDVPGWVLVVLMTTGLVTALWTIAAPRLSSILKNSLDSMNNIR